MMNRNFFNNIFTVDSVNEDEQRLILSSLPVFFLFSFFLAGQLAPELSGIFYLEDQSFSMEKDARQSKIFPVLVEQRDKVDPKTDQIRALSDVDSEGSGGITTTYGFHTLTPHDMLTLSKSMKSESSEKQNRDIKKETGEDGEKQMVSMNTVSASSKSSPSPVIGNEDMFRIPANYRFRNDFSLRYDGNGPVTLARQQLVGFRYFQNMLRYLRDNFAPPGMNSAYRDSAGLVISQSIKPQVVKVLFLLGKDGRVYDVRVVSSMGQRAVDQACIDILRGHNFGPPPHEIFYEGNIFGINFIFPAAY